MILAKIRKPLLIPIAPLPDYGGVWRIRISIPDYVQPTIFDSTDFDFSGVNQTATEIGNVFLDGTKYELVTTLAECRATRETWYYDEDNQILYVHVALGKRLDSSDFDTAEIRGTSSDGVFYDSDDNEYLPFISSNLSVTESADRLTYEKISFPTQSITFDNKNGDFDGYYDDPANGSDVEYKYISSEDVYSGSKSTIDIYVGYVSADSVGDEYGLTVKDKRAQLSDTWPQETFNTTDYPYLEDDLDGVTIPDGYGSFTYLPAYCTNGTVTSGNVEYKLGNSGTDITSAEVLIDQEWTSVSMLNIDSDTLTFEVSETEARDDDGNYYECRAVATMRSQDSQIGILVNLLKQAGIKYTSDYWDISSVASESSNYPSTNCNLYTTEEQEYYDYIEQIQGGGIYGFKLFVTPSGYWSIQFDDINRDSIADYDYLDNISDITTGERDFSDYATSVSVDYNYNPNAETYKTYLYDTDEQDIYNIYRTYQKKSFSSMLTLLADATTKAENIQSDYSKARGKLTFTIDKIVIHKIYDVITVDTSKYIRGEKIREYLGVRKIKLSMIEYDFENEQTTLTGYDITEV